MLCYVLPGAQDDIARQASRAGQVGGAESGSRVIFVRPTSQGGLLRRSLPVILLYKQSAAEFTIDECSLVWLESLLENLCIVMLINLVVALKALSW